MSLFSKLLRRITCGEPIVIVSGLPRSGTSMAMKMLQAGGLEVVTDEERTADVDNPKGYFEDERIKDLGEMQDRSWVRVARGKVIKVVAPLLHYLPAGNNYRVVFMNRNLHEVLASQTKMLDRRGESSETSDEDLIEMYRQHLEKVKFQIRFRQHFDVVYIKYRDVLENPAREARRINEFLGGKLYERRMAEVVDPDLYRNRYEGS